MEAHGLYWERTRRSETMSDDLILIIFTSLLKQHEGCFGRDLVNFNCSQMTRTTPELAPPLQTFEQHQQEDVWPPIYDLECNGPHTRRIFGGIGFSNWKPPTPKPRPYH
ncbi:hypothetical protein AVEN_19592-1 [Araneus ventricosus]|uniref:Uncharacterized protein n=1 Tax=Araneus ventricosus TaxID=182803 RepID=A0A4Y2V7W4_ARAVE|nr:hypothetical protein AVEN_19592-1 [Araneus ventricosus]